MKTRIAKKLLDDPLKDDPAWKRGLLNTAKLVGIVGVTILLTEGLWRLGMGQQSILMFYLLAVMVVTIATPSYIYGMLAALLCTFFFDFLMTEPRRAFSITIGFPVTLFTMLLVTVIISTLIILVKREANLATKRERRAELHAEMNQKLMQARSTDAIVTLAGEYIQEQLGRGVAVFREDPVRCGCKPLLTGSGETEEECIFRQPEVCQKVHLMFQSCGKQEVDFLEDREEEAIHLERIASRTRVYAVMAVDCREKPLGSSTHAALRVMVGQIALALELQGMSDEQSDLKLKAEKEKMRSTLLRSISHDLRTPLTTIQGACTAILEQPEMPRETHDSLVEDIGKNAAWLIRMVENILTVTRISEETLQVKKSLEAVEEVVSQSVALVRKRFPDCLIHVRVPQQLLLVPMDATLISQVLINLLENAVKNSEEGALVLLNVKKEEAQAVFEVSDHGSGIPDHLLDQLFELHTPGEGVADASKGIGIGLSICQTIIRAHGGSIDGHNREEGGARFTFTLPLDREPQEAQSPVAEL